MGSYVSGSFALGRVLERFCRAEAEEAEDEEEEEAEGSDGRAKRGAVGADHGGGGVWDLQCYGMCYVVGGRRRPGGEVLHVGLQATGYTDVKMRPAGCGDPFEVFFVLDGVRRVVRAGGSCCSQW